MAQKGQWNIGTYSEHAVICKHAARGATWRAFCRCSLWQVIAEYQQPHQCHLASLGSTCATPRSQRIAEQMSPRAHLAAENGALEVVRVPHGAAGLAIVAEAGVGHDVAAAPTAALGHAGEGPAARIGQVHAPAAGLPHGARRLVSRVPCRSILIQLPCHRLQAAHVSRHATMSPASTGSCLPAQAFPVCRCRHALGQDCCMGWTGGRQQISSVPRLLWSGSQTRCRSWEAGTAPECRWLQALYPPA